MLDAGLPNVTGNTPITGNNIGNYTDGSVWNGALYATKSVQANTGVQNGNGGYGNVIHIDASRTNAIYGSSTTVQPASMTSRYYIKY